MTANAYRGFLAAAVLVVLAAGVMDGAFPKWLYFGNAEAVLLCGGVGLGLIAFAWSMIAPHDPDFERARAAGEVYVDPLGEWWEFVISPDGYERLRRTLTVFLVSLGVGLSSLAAAVLRYTLGG